MKELVLQRDFDRKQRRVNQALRKYLPRKGGTAVQAMRYSSLAPAKRFRPALVLSTAEACGGEVTRALPAACAIEMIHTFSLIHDDLPAMDDDDFRRGVPTCHRRFGEAVAILAGDALCALAYEVLGRTSLQGLPKQTFLHLTDTLSRAIYEMICGQVMDLAAEGKAISLRALKRLYAFKTGALIRCSVQFGVLVSGILPHTERFRKLSQFAEHLGLAFQIVDDILDETGDLKKMGKEPGRDRVRQKATYPSLVGIPKAYEIALAEGERAKHVLSRLSGETGGLRYLVDLAIRREG